MSVISFVAGLCTMYILMAYEDLTFWLQPKGYAKLALNVTLVLCILFVAGCTTGVGYLWQQHENREFMATHHVVGDHWEENKR